MQIIVITTQVLYNSCNYHWIFYHLNSKLQLNLRFINWKVLWKYYIITIDKDRGRIQNILIVCIVFNCQQSWQNFNINSAYYNLILMQSIDSKTQIILLFKYWLSFIFLKFICVLQNMVKLFSSGKEYFENKLEVSYM